MSTLLLSLAGPLQAWGTSSRFSYRYTDRQPSKSAVLGLLAAAQGRARTDPIEDLLGLRFGVRCDQPGRTVRDFQTARSLDGERSFPLTYRYYLSDAAFVAAVEGESGMIGAIVEAVRRPAFPLYLGRRSCPPARPLYLDHHPGTLEEALRSAPWQASEWYRRKQPREVELKIVRDSDGSERTGETVRDLPVAFDPSRRQYAVRAVVRETCSVTNEDARTPRDSRGSKPVGGRGPGAITSHSPMEMWGPA